METTNDGFSFKRVSTNRLVRNAIKYSDVVGNEMGINTGIGNVEADKQKGEINDFPFKKVNTNKKKFKCDNYDSLEIRVLKKRPMKIKEGRISKRRQRRIELEKSIDLSTDYDEIVETGCAIKNSIFVENPANIGISDNKETKVEISEKNIKSIFSNDIKNIGINDIKEKTMDAFEKCGISNFNVNKISQNEDNKNMCHNYINIIDNSINEHIKHTNAIEYSNTGDENFKYNKIDNMDVNINNCNKDIKCTNNMSLTKIRSHEIHKTIENPEINNLIKGCVLYLKDNTGYGDKIINGCEKKIYKDIDYTKEIEDAVARTEEIKGEIEKWNNVNKKLVEEEFIYVEKISSNDYEATDLTTVYNEEMEVMKKEFEEKVNKIKSLEMNLKYFFENTKNKSENLLKNIFTAAENRSVDALFLLKAMSKLGR